MRSRNPNHPKLGSQIKVEPIRDLRAITRIKRQLVANPRDLCLFTLGINTAYRGSELLSVTVGQAMHLSTGSQLRLKQEKTNALRSVTINRTAAEAIQAWLTHHPEPETNRPLFLSAKTRQALTISTFCNMAKTWCAGAGLTGNFGSHSLRKTWGFHQLRNNPHLKPSMALPLLMEAYGHASQRQTLDYLCIQPNEVADLYLSLEL